MVNAFILTALKNTQSNDGDLLWTRRDVAMASMCQSKLDLPRLQGCQTSDPLTPAVKGCCFKGETVEASVNGRPLWMWTCGFACSVLHWNPDFGQMHHSCFFLTKKRFVFEILKYSNAADGKMKQQSWEHYKCSVPFHWINRSGTFKDCMCIYWNCVSKFYFFNSIQNSNKS